MKGTVLVLSFAFELKAETLKKLSDVLIPAGVSMMVPTGGEEAVAAFLAEMGVPYREGVDRSCVALVCPDRPEVLAGLEDALRAVVGGVVG